MKQSPGASSIPASKEDGVPTESSSSSKQPSQDKFRLITWNIDGLDSQTQTLEERTLAVSDAVKL